MVLGRTILVILLFINATYCCAEEGTGFSHYLNFYQVRYFNDSESPNPSKPLPEGLVEFTIGYRYENLPLYTYVHFESIDGHIRLLSKKTALTRYSLGAREIDTLFSFYGTNTAFEYYKERSFVAADKIQKAEIEKIHSELVLSNPELFPYGKELRYGVRQDVHSDVKRSLDNQAIPDSTLSDYQQGKTIVLPVSGSKVPRFLLNLNSPTVREYCVRRAVRKLAKNRTKLLFADNSSWMPLHTLAAESKYFSGSTLERQVVRYATNLASIFEEIKKRVGPETKLIGNGLVPYSKHQEIFLNSLIDSNTLDGMMCENVIAKDIFSVNIESWIRWINKLKRSNMKLLFCVSSYVGVSSEYNDSLIYQLWLWLHLVADDNVYCYINTDYLQPSCDYLVYHLPLGHPLEKASRKGKRWTREYQRGTIIFDTSSGKLSSIKFEPKF